MAYSRRKVTIDGMAQCLEALKEFSRATSGNILKRAVGVAGAMLADEAIARAPEDEGDLKRGIKVSKPKIIGPGKAAFAQAMQETGDRAIAAAAARAANKEAGGTGRSAVAHVGPTKGVGQGVLQEFGTAHHKAQPFMRPAWDANDQKAAEMIRDEIKIGIDKATERAKRKAARLAAKIAAGT